MDMKQERSGGDFIGLGMGEDFWVRSRRFTGDGEN